MYSGENPPFCLLCFATEKLSRCSRCGAAHYCSKSHQVKHWKVHKKDCKPLSDNVNLATRAKDTNSSSNTCQSSNRCTSEINSGNLNSKLSSYTANKNFDTTGYQSIKQSNTKFDLPLELNEDMFSSLNSELLSSSNDYWDIITDSEIGTLSLNFDLDFPQPKPCETVLPSSLEDLNFMTPSQTLSPAKPTVQSVSLEELCRNIINDLNKYGICVLDGFLGSSHGDLILAEVKALFRKGIFQKGEVVGSGMNENIRGDVITWISGAEKECHYISTLMKKLDVLMTACNKMPNNGILNRYKLNRRTKAMIACYPGDGTYYKKHVDNPHGDGRCITCIYYLNKPYDRKVHGGMLRMFPIEHNSVMANIEPIFDRMLFFWSDRRNPHEVLPSYAVRFAITVWYFDSDERDHALQKCKMKT